MSFCWGNYQQTIDVFGQSGDKHVKHALGKLCGPFYSGINIILNIPQFSIKLASPTSTTKHLSVATKFSGDSGIILQFDNDKGPAINVKGLDVSWLSRYKEEDERYCDDYILQYMLYIFCCQTLNTLFSFTSF